LLQRYIFASIFPVVLHLLDGSQDWAVGIQLLVEYVVHIPEPPCSGNVRELPKADTS
jgi:hypothetical protein